MATNINFGPEPAGATPLEPADYDDLIPKWLRNRGDLNLVEAQNIAKGALSSRKSAQPLSKILDDLYIRKLHRAMYGDVWSWAGKYRKVNLNIGVDSISVPEAVRNLIADATVWFEQSQLEEIDLLACKVHHELVAIHPFKNGNGRLCRLYTDLILEAQGVDPFTWGGASLDQVNPIREAYISALKHADKGDISHLVDFVRSK